MGTRWFICFTILILLPIAFPFPNDPGSMPQTWSHISDLQTVFTSVNSKGRIIKFPPPPTYTGPKKIPDGNHPFNEPGPDDMRGPCPTMNTLANHGYLPRNGIVTPEEIVEAVTEGFNMGYEFA